jgi:hypothetical protein
LPATDIRKGSCSRTPRLYSLWAAIVRSWHMRNASVSKGSRCCAIQRCLAAADPDRWGSVRHEPTNRLTAYLQAGGRELEGSPLDRFLGVSTTSTNGWLLDSRRYGWNIGTPQVRAKAAPAVLATATARSTRSTTNCFIRHSSPFAEIHCAEPSLQV